MNGLVSGMRSHMLFSARGKKFKVTLLDVTRFLASGLYDANKSESESDSIYFSVLVYACIFVFVYRSVRRVVIFHSVTSKCLQTTPRPSYCLQLLPAPPAELLRYYCMTSSLYAALL